MSLEATTNAIEDYLIDSISFKLQPGASYVTDRRSVSYFPSGSNIYRPVAGTKVIKITLTGDQWLDPSTVQLQFDLENEWGGTELTEERSALIVTILKALRQQSIEATSPN